MKNQPLCQTMFYRLFLGLSLFAVTTHADDTDIFPLQKTVDGITLERRGVSTLTVGYVFDVYVAALYQLPDQNPNDILSDTPRRLELSYLRAISKEDFIKAGDDMLADQHSKDTIASIQAGIEEINKLYQSVSKGDRYALTYLPGKGTTLEFNGEEVGTIEGAEFARIYFTIWLGEKNKYKRFRDRLVGL